MSTDLRSQIYNHLNLKETDELLEIWTTNNRAEWTDTAFEVTKEILEQRLVELPPQGEPIFEIEDRDSGHDENILIDKSTNPDDAPIFYNPKQVIWVTRWLNRLSIAAVVITIIVSIPDLYSLQASALRSFGGDSQGNSTVWLIALIGGGLAVALSCFIFYFSLRAFAYILRILMEMEFNSRAAE